MLESAELDYAPAPTALLAQVEAAGVGASVSLTLVVSEPVRAPPETLDAIGADGSILRLSRAPASSVVLRWVATVPQLVDGAYVVEPFAIVDLAGNTTMIDGRSPPVRVLASRPTLSVRQDLVSYVRAPAKNLLDEPRGAFTIPAGRAFFALAPADGLDGAAALPPETFRLADAPASALRVFADAEQSSLLLPLVRPAPDGSWPRERLRLPNLDTPEVWVTGIDAAGNESAAVRIENAWYVRSTADTSGAARLASAEDPSAPGAPSIALEAGARVDAIDGASVVRSARMAWRGVHATEPSMFAVPGTSTWDFARGEAVLLNISDVLETWTWSGARFENETLDAQSFEGFGDEALAYHGTLGRVVGFGSSRRTWEWDGDAWTEVATAHAPEGNGSWSMTYDEHRGVVVLFGGVLGASGMSDRTWIYDGVDWTDVSPASGSPPGRSMASMVYDSDRGVVLLFGGSAGYDPVAGAEVLLRDTWTWDGARWTEVTPASGGPPERNAAGMTFDRARGRAVLQGGLPARFWQDPPLDDTWEWDGASWIDHTPAERGPELAALFYDPHRGQVLAWGGTTIEAEAPGGARLRAWDGTRWQLVSATEHAPPAFLMAYDSARRRAVLTHETLGTWEWDGAQWTQSSTTAPSTFSAESMAYDAARGVVVLVRLAGTVLDGGRVEYEMETWHYDAGTWTLARRGGPPPRADFDVVFDAARGEVLLFGGTRPRATGNVILDDTWVYDGTTWTDVSDLGARTPGRTEAALAYDPVRQRVVRFGGRDTYVIDPNLPKPISSRINDVWEWDGVAWTDVTPSSGPAPEDGTQDRLVYDRRLARTLLVRGAEVWAWDGVGWQDLSPTTQGLPISAGFPVCWDEVSEATLLSLPSVPTRGRSWLLTPVTPTLELRATPPDDIPPGALTSIDVRASCGGRDPTAGPGARLLAWAGFGASAGWVELATSTSAGTALIEARDLEPRRFTLERDRAVHVQCRAAGDTPLSEVELDYAEVRFRYRTAGP
ncbi:hypothetical protein L6R52_25415 [Myxococcota bacterium]|nr:hypothetical protein [Myxococcota bacterium]